MHSLDIRYQEQAAWIWMNRPDIHNAFNAEMIADLTHAVQNLGQNPDIRVLILAGHGKSFSAGADLGWMRQAAKYSHAENIEDATLLARMLYQFATCPKPVIARVHGATFGGGVGLTAVADIAIASQQAKFCLSEVRLGLTPATISPYVIQAMGARAARRYFLTAERFDAQIAEKYNLIHQVCADDSALDTTINALITQLCLGAPGAQTDCKQLITDFATQALDTTLQSETAQRIAERRKDPEGQEGLDAFLNKRPPNWHLSAPKIKGDAG